MEAIASEAGVSKLTVYSHFTDKETLFSEAVKAKCAEQLPALYFQLAEGAPLEKVLLNIARGFHRLINSHEAIALTRLMAAQAGQNPKLSELFFEAGPKQVIDEMERLLEQARRSGKLAFPDARHAAEHFFMLVRAAPVPPVDRLRRTAGRGRRRAARGRGGGAVPARLRRGRLTRLRRDGGNAPALAADAGKTSRAAPGRRRA